MSRDETGPRRSMGGRHGGATRKDDPYAPMVPRWGVTVAWVLAVLIFGAFTYAAVTVPGQSGQKGDWSVLDRIMIFGIGAAIAWFLWRFATIRAIPSREGLVVRNILVTRRLTWTQIVGIQYGGGAPWVRLDLADLDTVGVMAVQKADGAHGDAMAARLAALIQVHGTGVEPTPRA